MKTAVVVLVGGRANCAPTVKKLNKGESAYLKAIGVISNRKDIFPFGVEGPKDTAVRREDIRDKFYAVWSTDGKAGEANTDAKRKAFNRAEADLKERSMIVTHGNDGETIWIWQVKSKQEGRRYEGHRP